METKILEMRRGISLKLAIFFLLLFILFWFVYNGVFSKTLALVYGALFLAISIFMFVYFYIDGKRIEALKTLREV